MLETSTIHCWVTKYTRFWHTLEVTLLVTNHYTLRRHNLLNNTRQTLLPMSAEYTILQHQLSQRFYIVLASDNTSALCTYYYNQLEATIYHQSRLCITSLANALLCDFLLLPMCLPRIRGVYHGLECVYHPPRNWDRRSGQQKSDT
jgi:hypothetical protein